MKYYIIAGEASGDLHASHLMRSIKKESSDVELRFWGGPLMKAEGGIQVRSLEDTAFMGFVDVVKNMDKVLANFRILKKDLLNNRPDVLILVDYPGFNLKAAKFARKHGIPVFYYISPSLWAWKKGRIRQIKSYVDKMFVILPFEKEFYKGLDYEVEYFGNPLVDAVDDFEAMQDEAFYAMCPADRQNIIALLPGSRHQEIKRMLPVMLEVADQYKDLQFVIAGAGNISESYYKKIMNGREIPIIYGKTYDLLSRAEAALVTSGTATLETAMFHVPQVVCYKAGGFSFAIAKLLVHLDYISLVNLIFGKEVVKELIQTDLTSENLAIAFKRILPGGTHREQMMQDYRILSEMLENPGVSDRIAKRMNELLNQDT